MGRIVDGFRVADYGAVHGVKPGYFDEDGVTFVVTEQKDSCAASVYFDAYGADREDQYRCVKCGGKRGQHLTTCTWRYNAALTDNCRACRYCRTKNYLGDVYKDSFNYCSICTCEGT